MSDDEEERTIWCGNLSEKVTYNILYELFYQAGPLDKVRIPRNADGQQRNFGFVTYTHKESVPYAMDLFRGTVLFDRDLRLQMQRGARFNSGPNPDLAMLLGRPVSNDQSPVDPSIEQKFIAMTNKMIVNGGRFLDSDDNGGNYDNVQKQVLSGNQQHWSGRGHEGRDRKRFEPYRRRDRSNERRDWGRDRMDRNGDRDKYRNHDRDREWERDRDKRGGGRWEGQGRGQRY